MWVGPVYLAESEELAAFPDEPGPDDNSAVGLEAGAAAERLAAQQDEVLGQFRKILDRKIAAQRTRVHGDYHLDNTLCRRDRPELAAVIDWELAHVGHYPQVEAPDAVLEAFRAFVQGAS